ncbi:hypothetical protein ANCDUO_11290 [Ancylostoma duodenale]|uniref:VWFA domain-containing protein n=1 Tax=Ancylostoma duodenale TaxID=51022 RepID=A0A0C2CP57_9BILA|nr:hypothetical protein ANCDUO_11290 [Ancylostoma duodenale]
MIDLSSGKKQKNFQLKQALVDFVSPFPIGDGRTQFALVATAIDSELYGTNFHSGQDRQTLISTLQTLSQDGSQGQTLKLSLQAISNAFLAKNYPTRNKLVVYFTGTTSWDTDPIQYMKQLSRSYGVKALAVQWTSGASISSLASFVGGSSCATSASSRSTVVPWLQNKMCSQSFCL